MKAFYLLIILCSCQISFAQQAPNAQKWVEVDTLELRGQVASALKIVNEIRDSSTGTQYLKASIFRWKFLKITSENAENNILTEIQEALKKAASLDKAILHTVKGKLLNDYFQSNRYSGLGRSTGEQKTSDLTTWSHTEIAQEIVSAYQMALSDQRMLLATPVSDVNDLLDISVATRRYRPTLYDVIAQEAMSFYNSGLYGVTRPETLFEIKNKAIFGESETFRSWDFKSSDSLASKFNAVKLLQEIEAVHQTDEDVTAYVYAQLERLQFARAHYTGSNKEELYEEGLRTLSRKHKNNSINALLQYAISSQYVDRAPTHFQKNEGPEKRLYYDKAQAICEEVIAQYPNSEASIKARQLLKEIQQLLLAVRIQSHTLPRKANRMLVSYRNLDSLRLHVIKLPANFNKELNYNLPSRIWKTLTDTPPSRDIIVNKWYVLPEAKDANYHTAEVLTPALDHGNYLFYLSNDRLDSSRSYAYSYVNVSDFGYKKTNYEKKVVYQFYDRNTGQPIQDLRLTSEGQHSTYSTKGVTDELGEYTIQRVRSSQYDRNNSLTLTAIRGSDTLHFKDYIYQYYPNTFQQENQAKTEIFLDREIYRPGQTMYFKGILIKSVGKRSEVVPHEKVIVYIEDTNYDEIYEQEVTTNEYGSFSGEFVLPENVLAGQFNIYAEEGDDDSKFWDENDSYNEGEKYFRVEAYKRPTFEITYNEVTQAYQPNDSITVTGNAKAFLGSNVTGAAGEYTIKRALFNRYWYYYNNYDSGRQIDAGTLKTDPKGNFTISFKAAYENESFDAIMQFTVNTKITDVNGETREESTLVKVGKKNLYTTLTDPKQVVGGQEIALKIQNKNLNDVLVSCDNTLRIFKIQSPDRVMFDRLWETPEHQMISEEDFKRAFPHEPYHTDSVQRPRGKMVYEETFNKQSEYTTSIPTTEGWEAGEYVIEHIATGSNEVSATTLQPFTITQPKNTYLPADQLFGYEQLNDNPKQDGYIALRLKTSLKNLPVFVNGFYRNDRFFAQKIDVNGNETIKITLDPSYEMAATIRVKYAQYDRFFSQDIVIDLAAPKEYLNIETQTFRSKLYPDSKEKWSFKITDEGGKKSQAEVLASMYDMSLDKFATSYWNPSLAFVNYNYGQIPSLEYDEGYVSNFQIRLNEPRVRRYQSTFDRFTYFGLSLKRNDYEYRNYLNKLRNRQKTKEKKMASTGNATGVVLDENGLPLPGVHVMVKGTTIGTSTDFEGQFTIDASPTDVLVFSYVGFISKEVVAGKGVLYATLSADANGLDEVVVVGYGTTVRKDATGALSIAESEEFDLSNDPLYAFSPSSDSVTIRGLSTVNSPESWEPKNAGGSYNDKKINFNTIKVRTNLSETAFFYPHLSTNKKGEIKFTFDAPQLLTKWKFRLLGHTKEVRSGVLEKEVITQKDLSLVPNTPRFLREGDVVVLSSKIANLTKKELEGAAQLQLFDAITMQPVDAQLANTQATQNFSIDAYGNTSIFWKIMIPEGMQAITYRMVAKAGKFSDGEENILSVLPNRMMVTEAVPFLVRAGQEKTVALNHLLENTSSTLAHQQFALEYTANPSWYALQSLPYLMEFPHECAEQTFSRLYANSLSAKVLNSNPKIKQIFEQWKGDGVLKSAFEKNENLKNILIAETPWLRNAVSETERKKRLGLLFDAEKNAFAKAETLQKLKEMQNPDGGFPWFSGGRSNVYITRHIIAGMGHLEKLGIPMDAPKLLENAIDYLDIELETAFEKHIARGVKEEDFYSRTSHLHFLYARSFFAKAYPIPFTVRNSTDKILARYNREWLDISVYEKGLLAVVNHRMENSEMAKTILTGLRESAVQSEINGMYWKENRSGWYWYQAPMETHSLLIEAFDEILGDHKTVEELKIWLIQQKRTSDWKTTKATAAATYALLMSGTNFLDLDKSVSFVMTTKDAQEKIDAAPREAGTGYLKTIWQKEEVTKEIAQATIKNTGTTAGYGGMYWQYFEDLDKIEKGEEQVLNLSKKLYLVNDQDASARLVEISENIPLLLGQTVRVQLIIKSGSTMEFVHLKDMRASGFEPVDVLSTHKYQDGLSYYQTTRDVATHFFFDTLTQGTHVLEYDLRVNNKGSFSNGISTIQSMYAPEFSGNTAGMRVTVE